MARLFRPAPPKEGSLYLGSLESEKVGLLSEHDSDIGDDWTESSPVYRVARGRQDRRRNHPLWNLLKSGLTVGWVGLLTYGLIRFFASTSPIYLDFHRASSLIDFSADRQEETPTPHTQAPPAVCQTPECIHAASEILYNLDSNYANIDPCTNFDQYVCGGWRDRNDMRSDQGSIFAGTLMEEHSETQLRHILERPDPPQADDTNNFKKLKAAYNACLDEPTLRGRGIKPLDELLAGLKKVYPVTNGLVSGSQDHLTSAILFLLKSGAEALVSPGVSVRFTSPATFGIS